MRRASDHLQLSRPFGYDSVQPVSLVVEKELGAALAIRILRAVEQSKIRPHALVHRTVWSVAVLHHAIVASPRRVDIHLGFHQHMPPLTWVTPFQFEPKRLPLSPAVYCHSGLAIPQADTLTISAAGSQRMISTCGPSSTVYFT